MILMYKSNEIQKQKINNNNNNVIFHSSNNIATALGSLITKHDLKIQILTHI